MRTTLAQIRSLIDELNKQLERPLKPYIKKMANLPHKLATFTFTKLMELMVCMKWQMKGVEFVKLSHLLQRKSYTPLYINLSKA